MGYPLPRDPQLDGGDDEEDYDADDDDVDDAEEVTRGTGLSSL